HLPRQPARRGPGRALRAGLLDPRLAPFAPGRPRNRRRGAAVVARALGRHRPFGSDAARADRACARRRARAGDAAGAGSEDPPALRAGHLRRDAVLSWLATALEYVAFALLFPFLLLHPRVRQGVRRRLGIYEEPPKIPAGPRLWFHGASAGDVLGLVPIIRELKALRP